MILISYAFFVVLSTQYVHGEISLNLYPLITPVLGNISEECRIASQKYIENLSAALKATGQEKSLTDGQNDALRMFDSNGPFPFLQEGRLQDTIPIHFCDFLTGFEQGITNQLCKEIIGDFGIVNFPNGYSNGPGSENQCRSVPSAQYCQNYYSMNDDAPDWNPSENLTRNEQTQIFGNFEDFQPQEISKIFDLSKINMKHIAKTSNYQLYEDLDVETSDLLDLKDIFLEKNSYARKVHDKLHEIVMRPDIQEVIRANDDPPDINDLKTLPLYFMMVFWFIINNGYGPGKWMYQPQIAYQGFCYPVQCSKEDIDTNNIIFAKEVLKFDPFVINSPIIPPYVTKSWPKWFADQNVISSVGCSNDEKYKDNWKAENYIMVTVLSVIGFFILVGTIVELISRQENKEKHKHGIGFKIITSFSLISNMEFIFKVSDGKKGQRFDCLEGMRAISMTWVILGHNFIFGPTLLTLRNPTIMNKIWGKQIGGHWLEAIKQGDFSVDSFLFIGATLLSFLLLKDLEKTNGWFHRQGIKRMILFYINRYLRITIPYALVLGVYIGIIPLMLTEPMRVKSLAYSEAESCKIYWWRHLTYNQIFGAKEACIGHTWYLAFDMIVFLFSPLVIYPFWLAKKGTGHKIFAISWWSVLLAASIGATVNYEFHSDAYSEWADENDMPAWDFAPWGRRNHCYLIGLMTGYILHVYKNKEIKINKALNIFLWFIAFCLGYEMVYAPWEFSSLPEYRAYITTRKAVWGFCLSWVTISCIKGYGGPVNDFLSWGVWQPISKISFMTYFFHMSSNYYYFVAQGYNVDGSLWLMTQIFVSQVFICLANGLMGCLALELPFGRIQKLLMR